MCCQAEWKREVVPEHKFDFVNTREFHTDDWFTRVRYIWIYVLLLKSFAVYCLDIFTAITMLSTDHWTNTIQEKCTDSCVIKIPFTTAKWIFVGCIIFSFLLLAYETYRARLVIKSRDISYAFTNVMANDYYSLRSYDNFCFFCQISNSTKKKDEFAFFIFFTFKDWKRLILADGPRQSINALILYSFAKANGFQTSNLPAYWDHSVIVLLLLLSMIATVVIFAGSMVLLIAAAIFYVPLLCYIQGNLKEYCCHKIDKRIAELIRRKQRQRVARNIAMEKKLAQGDKIRNKKGELVSTIPQPTLPAVAFENLDDDMRSRTKTGTLRSDPTRSLSERSFGDAASYSAWGPEKYNAWPPTDTAAGYPAMASYPAAPYGIDPAYPVYPPHNVAPSVVSLHEPGAYGGDFGQDLYGSSTNLISEAAPPGVAYPARTGSYSSVAVSTSYPPSAYHDNVVERSLTAAPRPQAHTLSDLPGRQDSFSGRSEDSSLRQHAYMLSDNARSQRPPSDSSSRGGSSNSGHGVAYGYYAPDRNNALSYDEPMVENDSAGRQHPRQLPYDQQSTTAPMRPPSVGDYRPQRARQTRTGW